MPHPLPSAAIVAALCLLLAACAPAASAPTAAPAKPAETAKPAASPAAVSPSPSPSPAASPAAKPAGEAPKPTVAAAPAGREFTIGVFQFVAHPALDDARKGALRALAENGFREGENLRVDAQNAQADMGTVTTIAQRFKDANVDLMLAIGTQPYQAALNVTKDDLQPPIVFNTAVEPYVAARDLVKSPTDKPANLTGVQALPPVEDAMRLVQRIVPDARKFGIVWNPAEANSEVATKLAREASGKLGIELIEQTVTKPDEVLQAAQSLLTKQIDVFFISTDSTVVSALEALVKVANDNQKPLFGNDPASAARGAAAALGVDYEQQGYESGLLAAQILSGQKTARDLPIEQAKQGFLAINTRAAADQGVKLPDDVLRQARQTYNEIVPAKR
jgi:putative tryptophan/tyrosine transport system substrate-binding protein